MASILLENLNQGVHV